MGESFLAPGALRPYRRAQLMHAWREEHVKHSRKVVAVGLVAAVAAVVATGASGSKRAGILVCGLMPDTKTSVRWEQFDRPYLEKAFKAAHVTAHSLQVRGGPAEVEKQGGPEDGGR